MDLEGAAGVTVGEDVILYAAPQNTSNTITARVTVGPACADGVNSHGGKMVKVNFYRGSTFIGWVAYAHIDPTVRNGQTISRWGTKLGDVGRYTSNGCWGDVHLHMEFYNVHNYACYNRSFRDNQAYARQNFFGFVGGNYASAAYRACP